MNQTPPDEPRPDHPPHDELTPGEPPQVPPSPASPPPGPPPFGAGQSPPQHPGQLGRVTDFDAGPDSGDTMRINSDERTMALLCHVLAIFTGFIGPLIIWLIKREESEYVNAHGRAALNFTFSLMIYSIGLTVLLLIAFAIGAATGGIGLVLICPLYLAIFGISIWALVLEIMRAVEASNGRFRPYPLAIMFFKHPEEFQAECLIGPGPGRPNSPPPPPSSPAPPTA